MQIKKHLDQSKKDCHQDNLSFASLQFYKHNCLNKLVCNICCFLYNDGK